jgi:hypothetical protein
MSAWNIKQNGTDRAFLFHNLLIDFEIKGCRILQKIARKGNRISYSMKRLLIVERQAVSWREGRITPAGAGHG